MIQILNARILIMKDRQTTFCICIEHGSIVYIGDHIPEEHKVAGCTDMDGRVIVSGTIDAHSHLVSYANMFRQAGLSNARSFADIQHILTSFIQQHHLKEQDWVGGVGYDHTPLKERRHPDVDVLKAAGRRPIVITHTPPHMGVAPYTAMQLANIPPDVPNPVGDRYGRNTDGILNGYMEENASASFLHHVPVPPIEEMMRLLEDTLQLYASYGVATVQDGMINTTVYAILKEAAARNILEQDVVGYAGIRDSEALRKKSKLKGMQYHKRFRIGGYRMFLDGSLQGRIAWMQTPYQGDANYYGYGMMSDEETAACIRKSLLEHKQFLTHYNGDAAAERYLTQFEKIVRELDIKDTLRPVMIHTQLMQRGQLDRMKPLQMIPSLSTAHIWHWGDVHIKNFGVQ